MLRLQFNYNQLFQEKHQLTISLGGEVSSKESINYKNTTRGYYPERGKTFGTLSTLDLMTYVSYRTWLASNKPTIRETLTNLASAYLAITYTYDSRYTLNFNTRIDGSNQFGSRANEKLLPIWSVSGRWDIKKDFFENSTFVNNLALKLSYGHQGNMLDNQTSKMIIEKGSLNSWYKEFSSTIKYYPNPDLKWELTSSYNAELEFTLWRNKIGGSIGYYYKHTKDAFLSKTVSEINGISSYVINQGEISNQGLEISLNITPINQKVDASGRRGFVWRFDPQIGQVVNNLISKAINNKDRTAEDKITYTDYLNGSVQLEDKPLQTFYSYRFKGLSAVDGTPIFYGTEDELKDELYAKYSNMTDEEVWETVLVESGTRVPIIQGGLSNYFGYRQFGLSMNFTYSLGNKVRLLKMCENRNISPYPERNMRKEFIHRWRRPGDELKTSIPGLKPSEATNLPWWRQNEYTSSGAMTTFAGSNIYDMYDRSDLRVAKGDYLKLQALSFRYNIHDKFCKKLGINSAYISVTGTNLFTISSKELKGQDVTQSGAAPTINMSLRPNYSFQLNVTSCFFLIGSFSCSDFLEEKSQNMAYVEKVSDLNELLIGEGYWPVSTGYYEVDTSNASQISTWQQLTADMTKYFPYIHLMDDDVSEYLYGNIGTSEKNYIRMKAANLHHWQPDPFLDSNNEEIEDKNWSKTWSRIAAMNSIIYQIGILRDHENDQQLCNRVEGEARFLRAQYYFWLANLYGQPYRKTSATTDLCIPLKTSEEVEDKYFSRATSAEVWRQIVSDLEKATVLLRGVEQTTKYRTNQTAAFILLSRVHLFKKNRLSSFRFEYPPRGQSCLRKFYRGYLHTWS